jgi:3-phenylpropionate/cinnamic acid dioxygenase small subunit
MDFKKFSEVQALHLRYAQILDSNDFAAWPDLFTLSACTKSSPAKTLTQACHCAS